MRNNLAANTQLYPHHPFLNLLFFKNNLYKVTIWNGLYILKDSFHKAMLNTDLLFLLWLQQVKQIVVSNLKVLNTRKHFPISHWNSRTLGLPVKFSVHMQETAQPVKLFQTLVVSFSTTFSPSVAQIYQQKMLKSMMMQLRLWLHDDRKSILKQIISTVGQKERQTLWKSDLLISLRFHNPREHL